jgi:hypothetical protein
MNDLFKLIKKGLQCKKQVDINQLGELRDLLEELIGLEKRFRIHGDDCYCGQPLPWHLADAGSDRFSHICTCERKFIRVIDGLLLYDGEMKEVE